jgi:hypothetical protein
MVTKHWRCGLGMNRAGDRVLRRQPREARFTACGARGPLAQFVYCGRGGGTAASAAGNTTPVSSWISGETARPCRGARSVRRTTSGCWH